METTAIVETKSKRRKGYTPEEETMFRDDIQRRIDEAFGSAAGETDQANKRALQSQAVALGNTLEKIANNLSSGAEEQGQDDPPADQQSEKPKRVRNKPPAA